MQANIDKNITCLHFMVNLLASNFFINYNNNIQNYKYIRRVVAFRLELALVCMKIPPLITP